MGIWVWVLVWETSLPSKAIQTNRVLVLCLFMMCCVVVLSSLSLSHWDSIMYCGHPSNDVCDIGSSQVHGTWDMFRTCGACGLCIFIYSFPYTDMLLLLPRVSMSMPMSNP